MNDEYYSEFETVAFPESFNYFGQDFTHIYVNENGFLTFGNGGEDGHKPWQNVIFNGTDQLWKNNRLHLGGGRVLHYLDDMGSKLRRNQFFFHQTNDLQVPDRYGKPRNLISR